MKRTQKLIGLSLIGMLAFTACSHNSVFDPDATGKVTELKVPQNFDWETSENMAFTVSAGVETEISVFADKEGKELLATLPVSTEATTYNLNVGKGAEEVYVRYTQKNGSKALLTVSTLNVRSTGNLRLPEDAGKIKNDRGQWITYYPKNGWGTLLFEDMWPQKGDYDLNDLAAFYKIQLYITSKDQQIEAIMVAVRLNALGGNYPYTLCLQMDDLTSDQISKTGAYYDKGEGYKWENPESSEWAVFSFDWPNKKGSNGGNYYNTEKEYAVSPSELDQNEIAFLIYPKNNLRASQINAYSFNFFIRQTDGKEIHLKGYKPTPAFQEKYFQIVAENDNLNPDIPYCTKDNFVWGLKVMDGIDHAQEKVDFTQAYKFFKEWVTSGGIDHKKWYQNNDAKDQELRIPVR